MNNIRIDWIDLTKGIAIFLMVCGHTSIPLSISNWIWSFHMPLFFIISGILFNATKYPNFNLFIKKRGKTLIIPYIIFSLITLLTIHDQTLKEWLYKGWINAIGGTFAIILITKTYFDNIYATPIKLFFKWAGHNTIIILGLSQIISTYIKIGFSYFSVPEIMNPFLRHIFLWIILYILSIIIRKYFPRIIGQK